MVRRCLKQAPTAAGAFSADPGVASVVRDVIADVRERGDAAVSAALGELCGRASRVERFEGHARSGDVRAAKFGSARPDWIRD